MNTKQITLRLDPLSLKKLKKIAENEGTAVSTIILHILDEEIARFEQEHNINK